MNMIVTWQMEIESTQVVPRETTLSYQSMELYLAQWDVRFLSNQNTK